MRRRRAEERVLPFSFCVSLISGANMRGEKVFTKFLNVYKNESPLEALLRVPFWIFSNGFLQLNKGREDRFTMAGGKK